MDLCDRSMMIYRIILFAAICIEVKEIEAKVRVFRWKKRWEQAEETPRMNFLPTIPGLPERVEELMKIATQTYPTVPDRPNIDYMSGFYIPGAGREPTDPAVKRALEFFKPYDGSRVSNMGLSPHRLSIPELEEIISRHRSRHSNTSKYLEPENSNGCTWTEPNLHSSSSAASPNQYSVRVRHNGDLPHYAVYLDLVLGDNRPVERTSLYYKCQYRVLTYPTRNRNATLKVYKTQRRGSSGYFDTELIEKPIQLRKRKVKCYTVVGDFVNAKILHEPLC